MLNKTLHYFLNRSTNVIINFNYNVNTPDSRHVEVKVKSATLVEGDPKAPFSIATTPRCRGGCYSFPWIALLYPCSTPYNAECLARWH